MGTASAGPVPAVAQGGATSIQVVPVVMAILRIEEATLDFMRVLGRASETGGRGQADPVCPAATHILQSRPPSTEPMRAGPQVVALPVKSGLDGPARTGPEGPRRCQGPLAGLTHRPGGPGARARSPTRAAAPPPGRAGMPGSQAGARRGLPPRERQSPRARPIPLER